MLEVRKTTNPLHDDLDIMKLGHIKQNMAYSHAAFLRLPTGPDAKWEDLRIAFA